MTKSVLIESFPAIHLEQVRLLVGGRRKLNAAESVDIDLEGGRTVCVELLRRPANYGDKPQVFFSCPSCRGACRVLRVVAEVPALRCGSCLRREHRAMYACQAWTEIRQLKYAARRSVTRPSLEERT